MRATIFTSVLAAVVLLGVAGCSTSTSGNASTTTVGGSTTGTGGNGEMTEHGAPRVKNPLDHAKFEAAPCSVLKPAQLQSLNVTDVVGQDNSSAVSKACSFGSSSAPSGINIGVAFVKDSGGLDHQYFMKDSNKLFQPIPPIQDYPAILNSPADLRTQGDCALDVGITDTMVVSIIIQLRGGATPAPRYADPCGVARDAADQVMTTLKGGS